MNIKNFFSASLLTVILLFTNHINAQELISSGTNRTTGCSKQAIEDLLKAINEYRSDSKNWNSNVTQFEFTLGGVNEEQRGILKLPINKDLITSANLTAEKFAKGTYPIWDHIINGEGPTMRAIKDGWIPSMNRLFYANEEPVFTMLAENLFSGSLGYTWRDVLNAWEGSPGHNTTLLSRGAVSIGCGCADTKSNTSGEQETYWVLLVELENSMTENDDIMDKYFKEGTFYKLKSGIKRSKLSQYKALDAFDFIDRGIQNIRDKK
ncbi:MAG: hypothetical protein JST55_10915 [Bacteroidetes bacterium]|nr:hypothetical protein [Bacteroidota bacterium]